MSLLPRGRPKKDRPPGLPTTKKPRRTKKQKSQVQENRRIGNAFEDRMVKIFSKYLKERDIVAHVYRIPSGRTYNQQIDILIDSKDFGYVGVECKSVDDTILRNEKINIKGLGNKSATHGHQFIKQHEFLVESGRYGLMAFWFKGMGITVVVPHQYIYDKMQAGYANVTITELLSIGYVFDKENTGSLKLYIRQKCKTA